MKAVQVGVLFQDLILLNIMTKFQIVTNIPFEKMTLEIQRRMKEAVAKSIGDRASQRLDFSRKLRQVVSGKFVVEISFGPGTEKKVVEEERAAIETVVRAYTFSSQPAVSSSQQYNPSSQLSLSTLSLTNPFHPDYGKNGCTP